MTVWEVNSGKWYQHVEVDGTMLNTPAKVLDAIPDDGESHYVVYKDGRWYVDGERKG